MSRTAFTAKLAMASRLSMVAAMVTVLPASADMVLTIPDSTDSIVPASTPVAYDEMTIPVDLRVIGDREPASLTGAAIISLTAILLREGKILPSGRMEQEQWRLNDRVAYTQADVRQLQLAKGAVA
ncbi:MAG: hypothetical protein IKJ45_11000, partial [Kiritimatiellae bacterium]|nr:hypothetical protein [Kiritimatiellia bacterium]